MANINKSIIMQAGAAVANATNKAAGLSAATPEPGSIISAIQLVNGGRAIGPAALAHFAESVRNKLLSLLVSMEPIQDFNGYGHPWPAGGGKNLFSGSDFTISTAYLQFFGSANSEDFSKAIPVKANTTYAVSIKLPLNPTNNWGVYGRYESDSTTTTFSANAFGDERSFTFTPTSDTKLKFWGYIAGAVDWAEQGISNPENVKVQIEESSTPTEWSPYSNICPISGRTGLNVYAGPTSAIGDATTYLMDWTTPAGTVYAGNADIVSGDIKAAPYYASYNGETLVGPWVSSMDVYDPEGTPTTGAQVVDLGGTMTEYHITGQDIITLVGDNYIWSDSGDVTITE